MRAAFRVTGLALSTSAVTGNYKEAKCVTCLNVVAESPRGQRINAGCLAACRNLCLVTARTPLLDMLLNK